MRWRLRWGWLLPHSRLWVECARYCLRMTDFVVRRAARQDAAFLREMQYEALFVPPGGAPFPAAIVDQPEIAHYYRNFGASPTDVGRIAASESGLPLGAAWVRLLTGADAGFGHVDDHTPELVIAVTAARRNRGLGAALLIDLLAEVSRCSLSVDARNPAVRLYERVGFTGVATGSDALTMLFDRSL